MPYMTEVYTETQGHVGSIQGALSFPGSFPLPETCKFLSVYNPKRNRTMPLSQINRFKKDMET